MRVGWRHVRLRDICSFDKNQGAHTGLRYVGLEHIESGTGRLQGDVEDVDAKSSTFSFSAKHVLYGRLRPYLKKVLLPLEEGRCSTEIFPILPRDELAREYLAYWLLSDVTTAAINATSTGARMPRANMDDVLDFEFLLPPAKEQQRIVAILDEAFAGIATAKANAERNLQNARELFESDLVAVFTQQGNDWAFRALQDLGSTQTGSTPKGSETGNYGNQIPFIKPSDFSKDGTLSYGNDGLSELGASKARLIPSGSVLMVCIGATIGKTGYCDRDVVSNQQINAFTPVDGLLPKFIYYQMTTPDFQRRVRRNAGQTTLPIINKSKWSGLTVSIPPIEEQGRIVAKLDELLEESMRLESKYKQKLAALDELKQSLLAKAFSGELC